MGSVRRSCRSRWREQVVASCDAWQSRIIEPVIEAPLALCQSDHLPLSEPAQAIKDILLELVAGLPGNVLPARGTDRRSDRHKRSLIGTKPNRLGGRKSMTLAFGDGARGAATDRRRRMDLDRRSSHSSTRWLRQISPRWRSAKAAGRCAWSAGRSRASAQPIAAGRAMAARAAERSRPNAVRRNRSNPKALQSVVAPLFGIVYLRPAPDAPAFVSPGQAVRAGTTALRHRGHEDLPRGSRRPGRHHCCRSRLLGPGGRGRPATDATCVRRNVRLRPHRQPGRDRAAHSACVPPARPTHDRRPFRGRPRRAIRSSRRPGTLHRASLLPRRAI